MLSFLLPSAMLSSLRHSLQYILLRATKWVVRAYSVLHCRGGTEKGAFVCSESPVRKMPLSSGCGLGVYFIFHLPLCICHFTSFFLCILIISCMNASPHQLELSALCRKVDGYAGAIFYPMIPLYLKGWTAAAIFSLKGRLIP